MKYFSPQNTDDIVNMLWSLYVPYLEDIGALSFCSKEDLNAVIRHHTFDAPIDIIKAIEKKLQPAVTLGKLSKHGN